MNSVKTSLNEALAPRSAPGKFEQSRGLMREMPKGISMAFDDNRFANPDNDSYYNVRVMKRVLQLEGAA